MQPSSKHSLFSSFSQFFSTLLEAKRELDTRKQLLKLSDAQLKDIGVTRYDVINKGIKLNSQIDDV